MLQKLPFTGPLDKNLLDKVVQQGLVELQNGVLDATGAITTRPGLLLTDHAYPTAVTGMTYWASKKLTLVVSGGYLYAYGKTDAIRPIARNSMQNRLPVSDVVQIALTPNWVYIAASSGRLLRWDGGDGITAVFDQTPIAPENVKSVAVINHRIVALEVDRDRVWYTKPMSTTNPELPMEWDGFFDSVQATDPAVSLAVYGSELLLFRRNSVEFWYDDGATPFRPVIGAKQMFGLAGTRAFTVTDNSVFWFTTDRKFVRLTGRTPNALSMFNMDGFFKERQNLSDCVVFTLTDYVVVTFPQDSKTGVYDLKHNVWYEWTTLINGIDTEYQGRCATQTGTDVWFLGGRDGKVYFFGKQAHFRDGTYPCRMKVLTPHFDHGTQSEKHSRRLMIKVSKRDISGDRPQINLPPGPPGGPGLPDPDWGHFILPPAIRCVGYEYKFSDTRYWIYTVESGLPAGWVFNSDRATLSGSMLCSLDTRNIRFRATHRLYGYAYLFTLNLEIKDFAPQLWLEDPE